MATARLAVKESLLCTTREPELSTQARATFDRNARLDETRQELCMTEEDFVNAVAPSSEDYVSTCWLPCFCKVIPKKATAK